MGNYTVAEFCAKYRIGKTRAYEEIAAKRLEAVKFGNKTLIPVQSAEAWQAALPRLDLKVAA